MDLKIDRNSGIFDKSIQKVDTRILIVNFLLRGAHTDQTQVKGEGVRRTSFFYISCLKISKGSVSGEQ
jgi:hypothetical protein